MVLTNINWQIEHATSRLVTPENQPVQGRGVPLVLARRPLVAGRQKTVTKCRLVICHGAAADVPPPRGRRATAPWQTCRGAVATIQAALRNTDVPWRNDFFPCTNSATTLLPSYLPLPMFRPAILLLFSPRNAHTLLAATCRNAARRQSV